MDNDVVRPAAESGSPFKSAAQWLVRIDQDEVDPATLRDFADWLESSTENRHAFARCAVISELISTAATVARQPGRRESDRLELFSIES